MMLCCSGLISNGCCSERKGERMSERYVNIGAEPIAGEWETLSPSVALSKIYGIDHLALSFQLTVPVEKIEGRPVADGQVLLEVMAGREKWPRKGLYLNEPDDVLRSRMLHMVHYKPEEMWVFISTDYGETFVKVDV